jgi:tRNA-splicing endonuclease subunit Sen2
VYEDPADQAASTLDLHHASPFAWSWVSTINRVNTQVYKVRFLPSPPLPSPTNQHTPQTLILTYVTIPARARLPLPPADPAALTQLLSSPACLQYYSVREVTVRRFIPARMRD